MYAFYFQAFAPLDKTTKTHIQTKLKTFCAASTVLVIHHADVDHDHDQTQSKSNQHQHQSQDDDHLVSQLEGNDDEATTNAQRQEQSYSAVTKTILEQESKNVKDSNNNCIPAGFFDGELRLEHGVLVQHPTCKH